MNIPRSVQALILGGCVSFCGCQGGSVGPPKPRICAGEQDCAALEICRENQCVLVQCKQDDDCQEPLKKCGDYRCVDSNSCQDDSNCTPPLPTCDLTTHVCSACLPSCQGRCCGVDGCNRPCGDQCAATGQTCNATTCKCEGSCTPNCSGKQCGADGCNGSCPNLCTGNSVCDHDTGQCGCTPNCAYKCCGSDGCPGAGTCSDQCADSGQTCNPTTCQCQETCTPQCDTRVCGWDQCQGSCGTCTGPTRCENGQCAPYTASGDWIMAGGNEQRTSWTSEQVPTAAYLEAHRNEWDNGKLYPDFFIPVEPFIPNKIQIVAANNRIYLSTARGLYAFDSDTGLGNESLIYATAMPLGHSPTYHESGFGRRLYVGGLDHRIHCIDADTLVGIWTYEAKADGIGAGFETNPLVLEFAGTVTIYAGNHDGVLYAIQDNGNSAETYWRYRTEGPILFSAAASRDKATIFFASQDSFVYALKSQTANPDGELVWKSDANPTTTDKDKFPGAGFSAYWPVIWQDTANQKEYILVSGSHNYRDDSSPCSAGSRCINLEHLDRELFVGRDTYSDEGGVLDTLIGAKQTSGLVDTSQKDSTAAASALSLKQYFQAKPYRRTYFVLDASTGLHTSFNGPFAWLGTQSGNRYPSAIMPDNNIYQSALLRYRDYIDRAQILNWIFGTDLVGTPASYTQVVDEPVYYAGGGAIVYWSMHTDLAAGSFDTSVPNTRGQDDRDPYREWVFWDQNWSAGTPPAQIFPGYELAMDGVGGSSGQSGWNPLNHGGFGLNGSYGRDGDGNPPIPYRGRVFLHKGNAILVLSPTLKDKGDQLPLARTKTTAVSTWTPDVSAEILQQKLAAELDKMVTAGHLRSGVFATGHVDLQANNICSDGNYFLHYFHDPSDTFWTIGQAMVHLPAADPDLRTRLQNYLRDEYGVYKPQNCNHVGFTGAAREWFDLPDDVTVSSETCYASSPSLVKFYGLWNYVEAVEMSPAEVKTLLNSLGSVESICSSNTTYPFLQNACLSNLYGYMQLQVSAQDISDISQSSVYSNFLNGVQTRKDVFSKDAVLPSSQGEVVEECSAFNASRNFIYLAPEVMTEMAKDSVFVAKVRTAIDEYNRDIAYWFVPGFSDTINESTHQPTYDRILLQVKAYILKDPQSELLKYLDAPGFKVGDLLYIQNLVAVLEAKKRSP